MELRKHLEAIDLQYIVYNVHKSVITQSVVQMGLLILTSLDSKWSLAEVRSNVDSFSTTTGVWHKNMK